MAGSDMADGRPSVRQRVEYCLTTVSGTVTGYVSWFVGQ